MTQQYISYKPGAAAQGVTSLNGQTGALTLLAGSNITLTPGVGTITISASGGGGSGVDTIGTIDSIPPSADGAGITSTTLVLQSASATFPGLVNTTTQSFAGNKTFTGTISASNLSGTNTGDVTLTAVGSSPNANGASLSGQALTLQPATASFPGALLAADWTTFNNKINKTNTTTTDAIVTWSNTGGKDVSNNAVLLSGSTIKTQNESSNASSSAAITLASGNKVAGTTGSAGDVNVSGGTSTGGASSSDGGSVRISGGTSLNGTGGSVYLTAAVGGLANGAIVLTASTGVDIFSVSDGLVSVDASAFKLTQVPASRALTTNSVSNVVASATTDVELGYVSGVTSAIQTQLNAKQATITIGALDAQAANANGLALVAGTLSAQSADATHPGMVNTTTQTFAGAKTFSGGVTATVTGAASGNTTITPNNHGVVVSGAANALTVIAPDSSTTKVLKSGGASADPSWLAYDNANTASTLVFRDGSGNFSAGTITAALTGTASGNTTYTPNNHGVVLSGSGNTMTVVAPDASTTKVLTSGGSSADPSWQAVPVAPYSVTSQTTTYSILTTDSLVLCSGSAFTVTLPTAVGVTGKQYIIKKTDTSLTNIITIATTSSQTVDGTTTYLLYTGGESITIVSDGSNWRLLDHYSETPWTNVGAVTLGGTTSAPTKASGITVDKLYWKRIGRDCFLRYEYAQSNNTSAAAGSGSYLIPMPTGITIDSADLTFYTTVTNSPQVTNCVGSGSGRGTTYNYATSVIAYDANNVRFFLIGTNATPGATRDFWGSGEAPLTNATATMTASYSVPASGWRA